MSKAKKKPDLHCQFTVSGNFVFDARQAEVTWNDGVMTGDADVIGLLEQRAKIVWGSESFIADVFTAPESIAVHLRNPYMIHRLLTGTRAILLNAVTSGETWPDISVLVPDGAIP